MTEWLRVMLPQVARLTQKDKTRYKEPQGFSSRLNRSRAFPIFIRYGEYKSVSTK